MHDDARATYPPLNTLKRVADAVWIVDGTQELRQAFRGAA
jgi:hypothetical protein